MDFSSVLQPLRATLLQWINKYPLSVKHQSLLDLSSGQFFSFMLLRVKQFKIVEEVEWTNFSQIATGERVKRMRIIGRSVTKYYQSQLGLSLDNMAFNYIEMCTSNEQADILRLFIAIIGILVRNEDIIGQLQDFMVEIQEEELDLFKIMIDYASKIGEKSSQESQSPMKKQKRLVSKLESLQQDIEFYEQYTEELQTKIQLLSEDSSQYIKKIEDLQKEGGKIVKRNANLQQINDDLTKQLQTKVKQQEILTERLNANREAAQNIVDRLILQNEKYKQEIAILQEKINRRNGKEIQISELYRICDQKDEEIEDLKQKIQKQEKNIGKLQQNITKHVEKNEKLISENMELTTKVELYQKTFNNRTNFIIPEQKSIVFSKQLGDSFMQKSGSEWFNTEEDRNEINEKNMAQSLSISQISEHSIRFPSEKGFLDLKNLNSPPKLLNKNKQNDDPNIPMKLHEIEEDKSFEMPNTEINFSSELELAMSTIFDLYSSLQSARKQLFEYRAKEAKRADRSARFAAKVNDMFS